jgi:general L-amino acid transport system permease protein
VPLITLLFTASLLLQYFLPPQTNFDLILRVIILVTAVLGRLYGRGDPGRPGRPAPRPVRGGRCPGSRLLAGAAVDHHAAGAEDLDPRHRLDLHRAVQGHHAGGLRRPSRPAERRHQIVRADINWKGIYWEPYIFVGAIFFIICFSMSRYSMYLERKLKTDHR